VTSIVAYHDIDTHELIDDALDKLARRRDLSLSSDRVLLGLLASLNLQLRECLEQALAESDLGVSITHEDIADVLGITEQPARDRYTPTNAPF
jgi:hypothetical protein